MSHLSRRFLPTTIASAESKIVYRHFPSGATLVLTHTDVLSDEGADMRWRQSINSPLEPPSLISCEKSSRLAAIYEAFAALLGADEMVDAARFSRPKLRACAPLVQLYLEDADARQATWQTTLVATGCHWVPACVCGVALVGKAFTFRKKIPIERSRERERDDAHARQSTWQITLVARVCAHVCVCVG